MADMIYRIVLFKVKGGKFYNEAGFREYFALIEDINYRYGCEKITILKDPDADEYAYISIWRDIEDLRFLKQASEYVAFVDELLKYADIVSDKLYREEA